MPLEGGGRESAMAPLAHQSLRENAPAPASAAQRFGVVERPDVTFTPAVARETEHLYERVKRDLLQRDWSDMNAYAEAKTKVIEGIKARARADRRNTHQ